MSVRALAIGPCGAVGRASQSPPSMACWTPNKSGVAASGNSRACVTRDSEMRPMTPVNAAVEKLAPGEEHIVFCLARAF